MAALEYERTPQQPLEVVKPRRNGLGAVFDRFTQHPRKEAITARSPLARASDVGLRLLNSPMDITPRRYTIVAAGISSAIDDLGQGGRLTEMTDGTWVDFSVRTRGNGAERVVQFEHVPDHLENNSTTDIFIDAGKGNFHMRREITENGVTTESPYEYTQEDIRTKIGYMVQTAARILSQQPQ